MDEPLNLFHKLAEDILDEQSIGFILCLRKPRELEYTISGFLNEEHHTETELFEKKLKLLQGGVDSNFSFEMDGCIYYPDEFKSKECKLLVNPLGGSDYLEYAEKGYVGAGWYRNDRFLFHLYISPQMARDIIERKLLAEHIESRRLTEGMKENEDWVWMKLRLDGVNFQYFGAGQESKNEVSFYIIRVYCKTVF